MKRLTGIILFLALICFAGTTQAKDMKSPDDAKALATEAISLFGKKRIRQGFTMLKEYWPIPEAEIENLINQTEMQWTMIDQRFGQPISVEFVREEKIAQSFIKYLFIQKFENHAIRWEIIFYKPQSRWKVNNVKWDDQIKLLFSH